MDKAHRPSFEEQLADALINAHTHYPGESMRKLLMTALLTSTVFASLPSSTAVARDYRWCAQYTDDLLTYQCQFETWEQCLATVSGVGGFCHLNPAAQASPRRRSHR
jgi:hypothetical protein